MKLLAGSCFRIEPLVSAALLLLLGTALPAQLPLHTRGVALASEFERWQAVGEGPIVGSGQPEGFTIEGAAAHFTLPDGMTFTPLQAGDPLRISGDGNAEIITILSVNCPSTGQACSVSADFSKPHPGRFEVSSGTNGVQEAINYEAAHGGGMAIADADFGGSIPALLPSLRLPSNVLLVDATDGQWSLYGLGDGGEPRVIAGFSSAGGTTFTTGIETTALNGARFASAYDFPAIAPDVALHAGAPVTLTPAWVLPAGLIAGDTMYLSGGTGTAEAVRVTNTGSACSSGTTASICFTPQFAHSGTWTLASATSGLQEAVNAAGAGGWVIDDEPVAQLHAPLVLAQTVRLSGFSAYDAGTGTQIEQLSPNTDTIQVGSATSTANDVVVEHLAAVGVKGDGTDSGVAIHCLNCVHLKLNDVIGKQAHDGLFFDSTYGHAYVGDVTDSHFIGNYYGVHMVGGSANRLTFVGDTVDSNAYGVFDDGGWVHTWIGTDIEYNTEYGYWQQVSQPAQWSAHNIVLQGDYFEGNGSTAGQGDVFLGQLVNGGGLNGNNGAGCANCEVSDNLFNATNGGSQSVVTALSLGASVVTITGNTFNGYQPANDLVTISGPNPNFTRALVLNNCVVLQASAGCDPSQLPAITNAGYGSLTIGGNDHLTDTGGTEYRDTTIESPTGLVRFRGESGGLMTSNPAKIELDGDSSGNAQDWIYLANRGTPNWALASDIAGDGGDTFCPVLNLVNPASGVCQEYIGPDARFQFSGLGNGPPGTINPPGDYTFKQMANGDSGIMILRNTDTTPSGYLLDLEDATDSHPLFRVDTSGNVSGSGGLTLAGAASFAGTVNANGAFSASAGGSLAGTFSGNPEFSGSVYFSNTVAMNAATVGGKAVNTDPAVVRGASGTAWSGTYTAGQCISGGINFTSGVSVGMVAQATPVAAPPAGLVWNSYIDTANHVTVQVCNISSSTVSWPSGTTFQVAVIP